jgi:chaperonin GroES
MKNVTPLDDRVLVKIQNETEQKTAGGIYIPETASKEKPMMGEIVAVGNSEMITVKLGQNVIFAKYSGTEIAIDNVDHIILSISDILAVVEL